MEKNVTASSDLEKRKKKTILIMSFLVVGMFGFGFAMVPLYKLVCAVTGINSISTQGARVAYSELNLASDTGRLITVELDATVNGGLPWDFYPSVKKIKVVPGEINEVSYIVKNKLTKNIITQAVPGVTPWQATEFLKKIECFCFEQQMLKAGEEKEMGLRFVIDPAMPKEIKTLTLSYTLMSLDRALIDKG